MAYSALLIPKVESKKAWWVLVSAPHTNTHTHTQLASSRRGLVVFVVVVVFFFVVVATIVVCEFRVCVGLYYIFSVR